jgi:hypothetical protein
MRPALRILFSAATLAASVATAQMHKVAKPEQVVRAVGVYEWTGDFNKPTASRLIPVTVFIDGKFEDAGVYIARPIPFALLPGNVYILQTAGIDKGTLDLAYARHLQAVESTGDLAYDDGWFGYGSVKPLAASRRPAPLKPSKNLPVIATNSNGPHFSAKPADSTTTDSTKPAATTTPSSTTTASSNDPDRPTMTRRDSSGTTSTPSSGSTGSTSATTTPSTDDPDRPTLTRRSPTTASTDSTQSTSTTSQTTSTPSDDPDRPTLTHRSPTTDTTTTTDTTSTASNTPSGADDPDRPTLKRHSPQDAQHASGSSNTSAVTSVGDLNADPNRPNLHHGKPTSAMTESELPPLKGVPSNLHQSVAISDAVNRDPHPFTLEWDDENQHQAILKKMQAFAQTQLAAYGKPPATAPPASSTPARKPTTTTTHTPTHKPAAAPPAQPLLDEELKAYTLSYGGAATYVYTANTGGTGAALRYVTIVAQADGMGDLKPAIQSVTDAAHLDRTPRMNFVDVVDAEASNRAILLFELRSKDARQFALYRVIASHPEQIFLTGTTQ